MRNGSFGGWLKGTLLVFWAACAGSVFAAPVNLESAGTNWTETPALAGEVIDTRVDDFVFNDVSPQGTSLAIKGSVESLVVREFESGTLDFYWRLSVDPDSYWGASYMNMSLGDVTKVGWLTDGFDTVGGVHPLSFNGNRFMWGFDTSYKVRPGGASTYFYARTDVVSYALEGTFSVGTDMQYVPGAQVQSTSPVYTTFSPAPEPESFMLAALGLGIVGLGVRRQRAATRTYRARQSLRVGNAG